LSGSLHLWVSILRNGTQMKSSSHLCTQTEHVHAAQPGSPLQESAVSWVGEMEKDKEQPLPSGRSLKGRARPPLGGWGGRPGSLIHSRKRRKPEGQQVHIPTSSTMPSAGLEATTSNPTVSMAPTRHWLCARHTLDERFGCE
jgi:hypothetical protein